MSVKPASVPGGASGPALPPSTRTDNLLKSLDYSVVQQCMHCGMCLPTCPTYVETGRERNSPRGRIALMRSIADGQLETTRTFGEEMSYCLGCLACTTACPAGVDYTTLFEAARAETERVGVIATPTRSVIRAFTLRWLFVHPRALRAAGRALWVFQASGLQTLIRKSGLLKLLPKRLQMLEIQTPPVQRHFSDRLIAEVEKATGPRTVSEQSESGALKTVKVERFRVAVLTGCVQDLVFSDVNRATVDVLIANGCDVVTPREQHCCGSLHAHNGDPETARLLARRQIDQIDPAKFDAIISNAGGCGSHLKRYDHLLADDPAYAEKAALWSKKLKDISEWLVEIGFRAPGKPATAASAPVALTYHEACHLCHGQKITTAPRAILKSLPGVELREATEATWCCGAAGIYSITQPSTSGWLLERKVGHLEKTGATVVATGNPGCHLQIQGGLERASAKPPRVVHPVVLLAEAYRAERA